MRDSYMKDCRSLACRLKKKELPLISKLMVRCAYMAGISDLGAWKCHIFFPLSIKTCLFDSTLFHLPRYSHYTNILYHDIEFLLSLLGRKDQRLIHHFHEIYWLPTPIEKKERKKRMRMISQKEKKENENPVSICHSIALWNQRFTEYVS